MRSKSKNMLAEIQMKRERMIDSARRNGIASEATIRYSQELDKLIYEYQCEIKYEKEKKKVRKNFFKQMIHSWQKAVV